MLTNVHAQNNVGVGPAKAISLIRQYKSIEEILKQSKVCHFAISQVILQITSCACADYLIYRPVRDRIVCSYYNTVPLFPH